MPVVYTPVPERAVELLWIKAVYKILGMMMIMMVMACMLWSFNGEGVPQGLCYLN